MPKKNTLLSPYRALDLTDEKGFLCGKILADMGADVIKIERPGGDPARRIGPFYHDDPRPEKSLYWCAYNTNKRGITLNIETAEGQQIFKQLVKTADFVIESFTPGYMGRLGLGYPDLEKINRRIIMISITPFGQSGPYVEQRYKVNDMILFALSGFMYPNGDPDCAPNQFTFPQAYLNGAAEAAPATLTALHAREITGEGQHVDVSIQEALQTCNQMMLPMWDMYKFIGPRGLQKGGAYRRPDGTTVNASTLFPCKDGLIYLLLGGGVLKAMAQSGNELIKLMDEAGMAGDLKDYDWATYDSSTVSPEQIDHLWSNVSSYLKTVTKDEFYKLAVERKILGCPIQDPQDIAKSPQLASREFFVNIEHPELGDTITYCGPFVKFSETPMERWRRAPLIGEHNKELYENELGFTYEQLLSLRQANII